MKKLIGFIIVAVSWGCSLAQDQCSALLEHGIYDFLRDSDVRASASQMKSSICTAYSQLQQDITNGSVKASYGLFDGQASLNRTQLESVSQQMCKADFSQSAAQSTVERASKVIDPAAVDAWRNCVDQSTGGIRVNTTFRESDQGALTMSLRYVAPPGQPAKTKIQQVILTPKDAFKDGTCIGDLMISQPREIETEALSMTCERIIANEPRKINGKPVLAPAATVQIGTAAGPVVRHLAAVLPPQNGPSTKEIAQSVLSQAITANIGSGSGCTRIVDLQICWGKQDVQPVNSDPDVRKFAFAFALPFSEVPVVTNAINGKTSGYGFSVYAHDVTTTGYSGGVVETTHRLAPAGQHIPFSETATINYIAIGKWQ